MNQLHGLPKSMVDDRIYIFECVDEELRNLGIDTGDIQVRQAVARIVTNCYNFNRGSDDDFGFVNKDYVFIGVRRVYTDSGIEALRKAASAVDSSTSEQSK